MYLFTLAYVCICTCIVVYSTTHNCNMGKKTYCKQAIFIACLMSIFISAKSQTDQDAIMMTKPNFCTGLMSVGSSWNQYWEGTFKRDNLNIGTISSNGAAVMGNYGVKDNLNLLFGLPYLKTKASMGTLHSQLGVQDLSLWIKWMPLEKDLGNGIFAVYTLGGASMPASNYIADYLPLSIGMKSKTLSGRLLLDYQQGDFFVTASETYTVRGNVKLERNSYYTTNFMLNDHVVMPNVNVWGIRAGYRTSKWIIEGLLYDMKTLGGFDITKNNMPFPSNRMNATSAGINLKYEIQKVPGLSLTGGMNKVLKGRNVGQSINYNAGVFYILDFSPKKKKETSKEDNTTQKN